MSLVRSSSTLAVACASLVFLPRAVLPVVADRPRCSSSWPAWTRRTVTQRDFGSAVAVSPCRRFPCRAEVDSHGPDALSDQRDCPGTGRAGHSCRDAEAILARCVQRQVAWLRSAVVHIPVVAQSFIEIPLLPYTWWSMSLLRRSCRAFLSARRGYSPWSR